MGVKEVHFIRVTTFREFQILILGKKKTFKVPNKVFFWNNCLASSPWINCPLVFSEEQYWRSNVRKTGRKRKKKTKLSMLPLLKKAFSCISSARFAFFFFLLGSLVKPVATPPFVLRVGSNSVLTYTFSKESNHFPTLSIRCTCSFHIVLIPLIIKITIDWVAYKQETFFTVQRLGSPRSWHQIPCLVRTHGSWL